MPGPMADCAKSTGAMLLSCNFFKAGRSSRFSSAIRLRRVACGASAGRLRHTSTMEDASALVPDAMERFCHFGAHGPCASNGKACLDDSAEHGFPAGGSGLFFSFSFVRVTLFIGIVDGHRHILAGILIDLLAGVQHTILKEVPCFFGTALKAVGVATSSSALGTSMVRNSLG